MTLHGHPCEKSRAHIAVGMLAALNIACLFSRFMGGMALLFSWDGSCFFIDDHFQCAINMFLEISEHKYEHTIIRDGQIFGTFQVPSYLMLILWGLPQDWQN